MSKIFRTCLAAIALVVATEQSFAAPVNGATILARQADQTSPVIEVRSRRAGAAIAAGVAGVIIGGIIASQRPDYYGGYYYGYGYPYGYPRYPVYAPYPAYGGAVAYCMRRFKSYDPVSMTYLGYDGYRHPCP